jgi:hypothetical protein
MQAQINLCQKIPLSMRQEAKTLRSNDQGHAGLFGLQQDVSTQYSSMIETA